MGSISAGRGTTVKYKAHVTDEHHVYGQARSDLKAIKRIGEVSHPDMQARPPQRDRSEMPQIPKAHQASFEKFLAQNGVAHRQIQVSPKVLKPTQKHFNQDKVDKMKREGTYKNKPISVSSERQILDGHHSWQAALQKGDRHVTVHQYSAQMPRLIKLADQFAKANKIPARTITQLGLIAACHDAGCRPPTSGGTGGSTPSGGSGKVLSPVSAGWSHTKLMTGKFPTGADRQGKPNTYLSLSSPHYQHRTAEQVKAMPEADARALVLSKDATGRRVLAKGHEIADGQIVGVRANLNLKKSTGITIQTIHHGTEEQLKNGTGMFGGEAIGYQGAVTLRQVNFSVNQGARAAIAEGRQNKFPMASVDGRYIKSPHPVENRFDGIEVSFNPMKHHTFVDPDGRAVKSASEATVVGSKVYVRGNITYYGEHDLPKNQSTVASESHA